VCSRIVSIVGVRGLVLTSGYRVVVGLIVYGRAVNMNCGGGMNAVPTSGEMRGSIAVLPCGVLRGEMEVGYVNAVLCDRRQVGADRWLTSDCAWSLVPPERRTSGGRTLVGAI
jgi:hypothetical protein